MKDNVKDLKGLLIEEMGDLLHAEQQIAKVMPKLAKAAHAPDLRRAFEEYERQTKTHIERLGQAFGLLGVSVNTKKCHAMAGLVNESEEQISEGKDMEDKRCADLALVIASQKVHHYLISGYGSLRALAERVGESHVARLLTENQTEGRKADEVLTHVSQPLIGAAA